MSAMVADQARREQGDRPFTVRVARGWLSLLRIDLIRGGGAWLLPIAAVFGWVTARNALTPGVALWSEITDVIATMANPLTMVVVGIGAYAGGREARRQMGDLMATSATARWSRSLSLSMSLLLWAVGVYAAFALPLLVYGIGWATWGGPEIGVLATPICMMALGTVFGVLVGRAIGGKTAPIVALALFILVFEIVPSNVLDLRALGAMMHNSWHAPLVEHVRERPASAWAQIAWGIGLAGALVGLDVWRERRTAIALALPVGMAAIAVTGALVVASQNTEPDMDPGIANVMTIPEAGICEDAAGIEVCVHPAYERLLPELARDVEAYLGPVAGLEGVVDRVYISGGNPVGGGWDQEEGHAVASISLAYGRDSREEISQNLWPYSFALAREEANPVQYVVMTALARNIDIDDWPEHFYRVPVNADDFDGEVERFAELPPGEQRAWLEAHWDDLIHGRLTVEDLP